MNDNQDENRKINADEKKKPFYSSPCFIESHYVASIYRRPYPKGDPRYDESFEVKNDTP
jgi:hypothetical protein